MYLMQSILKYFSFNVTTNIETLDGYTFKTPVNNITISHICQHCLVRHMVKANFEKSVGVGMDSDESP